MNGERLPSLMSMQGGRGKYLQNGTVDLMENKINSAIDNPPILNRMHSRRSDFGLRRDGQTSGGYF